MDFIECLGRLFPSIKVSCIGDPSVYSNLVLEENGPLPNEEELIAAYTEAIKVSVWRKIHAERERRKAGGLKLEVDGADYWFWTDDPSRGQYALLSSKISRSNLPSSFVITNWKTMSGVFIPMTVGLLYRIIDSGIDAEGYLFQVAENHRLAMLASPDPSAYNFTTNWPLTYEEFAAAN